MISKPSEEKLKKKEEEKGSEGDVDAELLAEQLGSMEQAPEDVYGEVQISTPETKVLQEIERFKEDRERERGEQHKKRDPAMADDTVIASDDDDDDDDDSGIPIKYYGYQIPKRILENIDVSNKINLEKSEDWLKIWLARVMEKVN